MKGSVIHFRTRCINGKYLPSNDVACKCLVYKIDHLAFGFGFQQTTNFKRFTSERDRAHRVYSTCNFPANHAF